MLPSPTISFTLPSLHDDTVLSCRVHHPNTLHAQLLQAQRRGRPWVCNAAVVAHPYAPLGGTYDDPVVVLLAEALLRLGYVVGTFGFRGSSGSQGRTSWTAKPEVGDYCSFVGFLVYYCHHLSPLRPVGTTTSPGPLTSQYASPTASGILPPSVPLLEVGEEEEEQEQQEQRGQGEAVSHVHSKHAASKLVPPVIILGGYSYGSLITTMVPSLTKILEPLAAPIVGSAAAEIRLRAQHLGSQQSRILSTFLAERTQSPGASKRSSSLHLRVGGDEAAGPRRKSHESHTSQWKRSFSLDAEDKVRKGVMEYMEKKKMKRRGRKSRRDSDANNDGEGSRPSTGTKEDDAEAEKRDEDGDMARVMVKLDQMVELMVPKPAYLLVSPLQGFVTHLATMSLFLPMPSSPSPPSAKHTRPARDATGILTRLLGRNITSMAIATKTTTPTTASPSSEDKDNIKVDASKEPQAEAMTPQSKLVRCPTLAIYGDGDNFSPVGKLRDWAGRMRQASVGSQLLFRAVEVAQAGHFWAENGVASKLREAVEAFGDEVLRGRETSR